MKRKPLAIFGAGGLGRELGAWIQRMPEYELIGFFDDTVAVNSRVGRYAVLGGADAARQIHADTSLSVVIAVGNPHAKWSIHQQLSTCSHIAFPAMIHPLAVLDDPDSIMIGEGTVITAGCVLTTQVAVGKHVLLNLNSTLGHDARIGDYTSVMPGVHISGMADVGERVLLGTGSCLLNKVRIGDEARVGAGAVVVHDIPARCTAVGVPAKPLNLS